MAKTDRAILLTCDGDGKVARRCHGEPMSRPEKEAGRWIDCGSCINGVVSIYSMNDFEGPGECRSCNGTGRLWAYASGRLALYPGGPLMGRRERWGKERYG